ncbi:hypothetical protein WMY93_010733 [Mugilogobius chulae]|uniref:DAD domain-containing protein n=1 Tax=Mugilogobius chulae TaxID=88201 RepID=A0AAW0PIL3_9GOBI
MPLFNWQALKSHQVTGTVFNELDDEHVLEELNMNAFEEQFKTKAQASPAEIGTLRIKLAHKTPSKVWQALDELSEEDRFMVRFGKIPRLAQRISTLTFMGNFTDSVQLIQPLSETKSTDRRQTLLHFIVNIIQENIQRFLHFTQNYTSSTRLLWDVYDSAVEYFGENPKTMPPAIFFPIFVRFIKAYKQAELENEQRKRKVNCEPPLTSPKPDINKVSTMPKLPQMDLIAELKKRQSTPLVREGKDGAIEDIITDLRNQPYRRADAGRRSAKWKPGQQLQVSSDISL